ncbi:uncharacterized protein LOC128554862 [Mercenaria mercenaria]|uniref:uncharacterized protein LOC128554862 n=1 Tax=Mercenaria mercenaria TaxID=6596 RepID=UPI00234F108B|nr:uncharacterized protein LOC128554862 [Mercenaria mercenaria]
MPPMPPFQKGRVTEAVAFERTYLGYLGPLYIKTSGEYRKVWVCLFTCLVTRAVHLETVQDMSTEEFLLALRRFIAQRGSPMEINSDNAKQFKLASIKSDDVQTYISNHGIKWNFIVERAPWYGGYWERIVGLVKRSLRKSLGRRSLTDIQLLTVIKEIESVINSRPFL